MISIQDILNYLEIDRADADLNLWFAIKARIVSQTTGQMCEEAKTEYANQLQCGWLHYYQHYC